MLFTLGDLALNGTRLRRPKPLLLLAYLALEGATPRRKLAKLFFGNVKDPNDSLTTALKHLKRHPTSDLHVEPKVVSTGVKCDVLMLLKELNEGRIADATGRYRGAFLDTLDLLLGEELEDWVYAKQDEIAQRFRLALIEHAESQSGNRDAVNLAERGWRLTRNQGLDANTLGCFYRLFEAGGSPLTHEVRRYASEYGIPLCVTSSNATAIRKPAHQGSLRNEDTLPSLDLRLRARLEELRVAGDGLAICLWGEPGVGKSWTAEKVCRNLSFPHHLVPANLRSHLVTKRLPRAGELPKWARTALAHVGANRPISPAKAADAIAAVLAANAPIVLWVEDLHEANEERSAFWTLLAQAVRRSPGVGLISTSRSPPDGFDAERLGARTHDEIKEILEAEAGKSLPPDALTWIGAQAKGNPLFALEFYRFLRKRGNLWFDGRIWNWRVPTTLHIPGNVEALVSHTVRRLPLDDFAKTFMWAKALLPAGTSDDLIAQVAGLDDENARRAASALSRHGVISGSDFVHPLYREVQAALLASETRRHLATRIVALFGTVDPELAAPLAVEADLADGAARELLTRAAQEAFLHGRTGKAGEFFAQAADYAEGPEKRSLLLKAANCFKDCRTARAQRLVERVLEAEPQNHGATLLLARCLVLQGEGERAERLIQRLPEAVEFRHAWFEQLIELRVERNDYQGALLIWEAHPELQVAANPDTKRNVAVALINACRYGDADFLANAALGQSGLGIEERAALLEVRGLVACYTGAFADSLTLLDESVALFRLHDKTSVAPKLMRALRSRLTVYWALSRQQDAIRDSREAMKLATELGSGRDYAIAQTYLGVPLGELGDYEGAEAALLESREVLRRADAREHLSACEAILSGVYLNWRRPVTLSRALRHAYKALQVAEEVGSETGVNNAYFYVSWAELVVGEVGKAMAYAQRGLGDAQRAGRQRATALFLWLRGLAHERMGHSRDALADLNEAVLVAERMELKAHRLHFLIDRDRLRDDREAVLRHVATLERLGVVAFNVPARHHYLEFTPESQHP